MKRYGMWAVFGLAVIPNPLFDIVGIVSGVLRIPVWRFFFACWAGNVIKATAIAFAGMGASPCWRRRSSGGWGSDP